MIQTEAFALAKSMARIPFGRDGKYHFYYLADIRQQWESANASAKLTETVGNLSGKPRNLAALKRALGSLSAAETDFVERFGAFYRDVCKLTTSLPSPCDWELDAYETVYDHRVLEQHVSRPMRMLDIGPGAGRHMVGMFLREEMANSSYVGVDSVGLPYAMQNLAASYLTVRNPGIGLFDEVDARFSRTEFAVPGELPGNNIWHLPLWRRELLPAGAFDVIVCNYILDELPPMDFIKLLEILPHCLAPEGVIYCRGSQERAMLANLYLYGQGTYHQMDITKELLRHGFKVKTCDMVADTITRTFVRADSKTHVPAPSRYAACTTDAELVEAIQTDFVKEAVATCQTEDLPVVIWGDRGFEMLERFFGPYLGQLRVVGITNDHVVNRAPTRFGIDEVPLKEIAGLGAKAVLIAGVGYKLAERELFEALESVGKLHIRSFNLPIGFGRF